MHALTAAGPLRDETFWHAAVVADRNARSWYILHPPSDRTQHLLLVRL
jgi:hypothetical protein